jgi:hypothetical protein
VLDEGDGAASRVDLVAPLVKLEGSLTDFKRRNEPKMGRYQIAERYAIAHSPSQRIAVATAALDQEGVIFRGRAARKPASFQNPASQTIASTLSRSPIVRPGLGSRKFVGR